MAKENFLLVAAVIIVSSVVRFGITRLERKDWITLGLVAGIGLLDGLLLVSKVAKFGSQYPQPRNIDTFLQWYQYAQGNLVVWTGLGAAMAIAIALLLHVGRPSDASSFLFGWVVAVVVVILQLGFYAGGPMVGRYLYPLAFFPVIVWSLTVVLVQLIPRTRARIAARCAVAVILVFAVYRGVDSARTAGVVAAETQSGFAVGMAALEAELERSEPDAVVLQPSEPLTDIERVLSLARYVNARTGVKVMTLPATAPTDEFSQTLAKTLESWSVDGALPAIPLAPYTPTDNCFSIMFGANTPVCPASAPSPG